MSEAERSSSLTLSSRENDLVLFIIDGTGPDHDSDYFADMRGSFCHNLHLRDIRGTEYERGPNLSGLTTWQIADKMRGKIEAAIVERERKRTPLSIYLAGHSRGGAAVIDVARKLAETHPRVRIRAMVLFDAVRRALKRETIEDLVSQDAASVGTGRLDGTSPQGTADVARALIDFFQVGAHREDVIPGNVDHVLHVLRDEEFSMYFKRVIDREEKRHQKGSLTPWGLLTPPGRDLPLKESERNKQYKERKAQLQDYHRRLRDACRFNCILNGQRTGFSFANTGISAEPPCRLTRAYFWATHGAMGGAPLDVRSYITDPKYAVLIEQQEVRAMRGVQSLVSGFLKQHGLNVDVTFGSTPSAPKNQAVRTWGNAVMRSD